MSGGSHREAPGLMEEVAWTISAALAARTCGVALRVVVDIRGRETRATGECLRARRMALYLASVGANLSRRALQRATGMDHRTLQHHLRLLEDARDLEPVLDGLLDELARRLAPLAAAMAEAPKVAA